MVYLNVWKRKSSAYTIKGPMDLLLNGEGNRYLSIISIFLTLFFAFITPTSADFLSKNGTNLLELSADLICNIDCYEDCYERNQGNSMDSCLCNAISGSCNYSDQSLSVINSKESYSMEGFYEDAHVIVVNSKIFPDAFAYFLEARIEDESQWKFYNSSHHPTLRFTVPDVCQRYKFRISVLFPNNDTILTLPPSTLSSNPPDFVIENVQLEKLEFEKELKQVAAEYFWKHPWGYEASDVHSYLAYVHPTICSVPEGLGLLPQPEITSDGGRLVIRFPEIMAQAKCQFLIQIEGTSTCGQRIMDPAQVFLQLNCQNIKGYPCGQRTRPYCLRSEKDKIHLTGSIGSRNETANLSLRWTEPPYQQPLYYHVRYGEARSANIFGIPGLPPPNPGGENFPGPQIDMLGGMFQLGRDAKDMKIEGNQTTVNFPGTRLETIIGLQICAIYSSEYKLPNFQMLEVLPYNCICGSNNNENVCPNVICGPKSQVPLPVGSQTTTSSLSNLETTAATTMINENWNLKDFTETVLDNSSLGSKIQIAWTAPESARVLKYRVILKSESGCTGATAACCNFAQNNPMAQPDAQLPKATLSLPHSLVKLKCKFVLKVETALSNGQSITSTYSVEDRTSKGPDTDIETQNKLLSRLYQPPEENTQKPSTTENVDSVDLQQNDDGDEQKEGRTENSFYSSTTSTETNSAASNNQLNLDPAPETEPEPSVNKPGVPAPISSEPGSHLYNERSRSSARPVARGGLPPDVALALKIVLPISLLLIVLALLSVLCFYRWKEIKEFFVKRHSSSIYRPSDWQARHTSPGSSGAIDLQESRKFSNGRAAAKVSCTSLTGNGSAPRGITAEPGQQRTFVKRLDL